MQFGLSIVGYSKNGLVPVVSTKLPFLNNDLSLDTFLYRFSTPIGMLLGQGDIYKTGLFGPYPVFYSNDYVAYSYSFFLPDTILSTPRDDQNAYLIAIFFLPKSITINVKILEDLFSNHCSSLSNLDELISKEKFNYLVNTFKENLFFGFEQLVPNQEEVVLSNIKTNEKKDQEFSKKNDLFVKLDVVENDPESLIAIPWILHAVYHGLEQATIDILGDSSPLLEMLMEQYTAEILDRYHLFDTIFNNKKANVKDALELGVKHLGKVGEFVTVKALDTNKYECSINCSFAESVHPYLPINKCLWVRYLSAMVRYTLPKDKDLLIHQSDFDPAFGSKTTLEIIPKVFKEI